MTEKEKRTILDMRAAGKQYKEISAELGIDVSALNVFVHRQNHDCIRRTVQEGAAEGCTKDPEVLLCEMQKRILESRADPGRQSIIAKNQ